MMFNELLPVYSGPSLIISGGQCGADAGAVRAAAELGIATLGWMPSGYTREDGNGKEFALQYNLLEATGGYSCKDKLNVDKSDMVLGFVLNRPKTGRGTTQTVNYALGLGYQDSPLSFTFKKLSDDGSGDIVYGLIELEGPGTYQTNEPKSSENRVVRNRPCMLIGNIERSDQLETKILAAKNLIRKHRPLAVMVSGPCESTEPGTEEACRNFIHAVLTD